jgi:hypothetical protein
VSVVTRNKLQVTSLRTRTFHLNLKMNDVLLHEALWDAQFAASQDVLEQLADEAHQEYLAGLTEDFDPDNDFDAP